MSTATSPIRFRCFRCSKLLGISRTRAGAVVSCPQCAAELIVPEDGESASPPRTAKSAQVSTTEKSGSRIEPIVVPWDAPPEPEIALPESDDAFPTIQVEPVSLRSEPPARARVSKESQSSTLPPPPPPDFSAIGNPPAVEAAKPHVEIPAVAIEPPSLREAASSRSPAAPSAVRGLRRDDVALPRTAVILWSLLVLLALVAAFAAGLLIGRFVWARGVATKAPIKLTAIEGEGANRLFLATTRLHPIK